MKQLMFSLISLLFAAFLITGCTTDSLREDVRPDNKDQLELRASNFNFTASLSGDHEVPPNNSNAAGECIVRIAKDEQSIYYKLIVANIDDVLASHFHMAPEGVNGPVVAFLFSGPAPGPQNGILAEGTITASDVIGPLAGDLEALMDAIRNENIYVNVHTAEIPSGEIRGQVN